MEIRIALISKYDINFMKKNKKKILDQINNIFLKILKINKKNLLKANMFSCINWDSLNHARLISAIEKELKTKVSSENYIKLHSYKEICDLFIKSLK